LKKENVLKYTSIFSVAIFIFSFSMVDQLVHVFAHSFNTDDTSYFLGLDKRTKVELELAEKNYPLNITLSMDHSDNAARLVYDIYYVDEDIVEDSDFTKRYNKEVSSSNSTTYALVVADLLDEVLREYAEAVVVDIDLTNMSNLALLDNMKNLTTQAASSENDSPPLNYTKFFSNNNPIFNYANYETAKALLVEIKDIFENHLKSSNNLTSQSISVILTLEKNLEKLSNLINNNNGSPAEVMELVHLQIHPSLQTAFGLQTKMNMNMGQMNMDGQMNMNMSGVMNME
jgi:Tfp pilus assembly protein PilE